MAYFKCDGSALPSEADPSAYQCSTGWLAVDEPTFTLVTQEQASELLVALICLGGLAYAFRVILKQMGF